MLEEYLNKDIDSLLLTIEKPFIKSKWYIIVPKEGLQELYLGIKEYGDLYVGGKIIDITEFIN